MSDIVSIMCLPTGQLFVFFFSIFHPMKLKIGTASNHGVLISRFRSKMRLK